MSQESRRRSVFGLLLLAGAAGGGALFLAQRSGEPRTTAPPSTAPRHRPAPTASPPANELPKRRVHGRVLGPDGNGVEGADVAVFRLLGNEFRLPRPEPGAVGRTGADGRFDLEIELARDLALGARTPGLSSALVSVADARRELILRLANTYEVRGWVSDAFAPVGGCEVVLEPEDERFFAQVTQTGADGAFRFASVHPGLIALSARTASYRPAVQRGIVVGSSEPLRLHFPRDPALSLQGRVSLDGQPPLPAAGAVVRATQQRDDRPRPHAVPHVAEVRADGSFELQGLAAGLHRVEIAHPERSTATRVVEVTGRDAATLEVKLPPRAPVRGLLVGKGLLGAELASTELLLVTQARERGRTRTDTAGRFEFAGTYSAGSATLVLLERAMCFERTSDRRITFEVGGEPLSLSVASAPLLAGDVVDPDGAPIAGVEVYVESEWEPGIDLLREPAALTDAAGRYRLHVAPNAAAELTMRHPAFAAATVRLPRQASGVQQAVTLHRPGKIVGVVRRDSRPLPAAIVHRPADPRAWATTGPDGVFTLHGVPPGEHQLIVRYGTLTEFSTTATVLPGRDTDRVEFALPPGRSLVGRVVDPFDRPLQDVWVSVDALSMAVATDADGRFTLDAPRGEVQVRAYSPEWRLEESQRIAADDNLLALVLPVPPHGRVHARLQGLPGQRLPGVLLTTAPRGDHDAGLVGTTGRATTQWVEVHDGAFDFRRFPAGRVTASIRCSGYVPWRTDVDLAAGSSFDLGPVKLEPGARVRGVVLDDGGRPVSGARVLLGTEADVFVLAEAARASGDDVFGARADLHGRFELGGVSSNLHTLVVQAAGYATATVGLQIPTDLLRPEPLAVKMSVGGDIVVEVVDSRDQPLAGRTVELRKSGFAINSGRTDSGGRCVFRHGSRGEYRLAVLGTTGTASVDLVGEQQSYHVLLQVPDR